MKLVAAVIAGMLGIIVYRSLKSGVVHWGRGREAVTVQRAEEPVSYWLLIVFQLVLFGLMAICTIALPGPTLPA